MTLSLIVIPVYIVIFVGVPVLIGVYVYHDAVQRGMNAILWTLLAVLAPAFIGFIIYLLVRSGYSDLKCPNCAATVTEQFTVCPVCGAKLKDSCPNCNFPTEPGWTVCPKCASPLPEHNTGFIPPVRKKDKALGKILLVVILIPILLFILLLLFSFTSFSGSSAMNTAQLSAEIYKDLPEITSWIKKCDENPSKTYALRYQSELNGQKTTSYLIYRPSARKNADVSSSYNSGLFSTNIEVRFTGNSAPDGAENQLTSISGYSNKFAGLKVFLNNKKIACEITEVNYNPALFVVTGEKTKKAIANK